MIESDIFLISITVMQNLSEQIISRSHDQEMCSITVHALNFGFRGSIPALVTFSILLKCCRLSMIITHDLRDGKHVSIFVDYRPNIFFFAAQFPRTVRLEKREIFITV